MSMSLPIWAGAAQPTTSASVAAKMMDLPLSFQSNKGQAPQGVDFVSKSSNHSLYLEKSGMRLDLRGAKQPQSIVLKYVHPEASLHSEGVDFINSNNGYFIGSPDKWIKGVSSYQKVRYSNVWRGIDVVYYGNHRLLEYDLVVAAGADASRAAFEVSGAQGLRVDANGDLLIRTASGEILEQRPVAYQNTVNGRSAVEARYALSGDTVSFEIGEYDRSKELIIDPIIAFSFANLIPLEAYEPGGVAVDTSGNIFVSGTTLPGFGGSTTTSGFVVEIGYTGSEIGSQEFGSGTGNTTVAALATDNSGSAYITGNTTDTGVTFGTQNAYQGTSGGGSDAFLVRIIVAKVELVYSTYLGGSGNDGGTAVAADSSGNAYVVGQTASANFPRTSGSPYAGGTDVFLAKINTNASGTSSLTYSYLAGGSGNDVGTSVGLDTSGNVYVGGFTQSTTFSPNPGFGYVTTNPAGSMNGFVLKLNSTSLTASYLTFFVGGEVYALAVDSNQQAYVTGNTDGAIPTNSVNQGYATTGGANHAFIARFSTTVTGAASLIYSSYLAGGVTDAGFGIAVDGSGNATVVGSTNSFNFPVTASALQRTLDGAQDAFLSKVNTNASLSASLVYSSYLGGSSVDSGNAVALTPYGNPVVLGQTESSNFPVTNGNAPNSGTLFSVFLTKFYFEAAPFGSLDTPVNNSVNVAGAVGVTGWALSTIAINNVAIWRAPVPGEAVAANGLVYVGTADQINGSRPDVAARYPGYPNNNWGWGLQVLTNELPGNGKPLGNGTYTFHALATDNDGYVADIGQTTITVNNAASIAPFGTIDTPLQGGTESGTFVNFGWALTPQPNMIPTDGSTIEVYIDSLPVGHPVYNQPRADIEALFPGYKNTDGAVGYFYVNTLLYQNGLHTISWLVKDNVGNAAGIGSRYFTIANAY
jgi:hypothetical protein